ncbi:hypothetical protein OESDEN_10127 [Oesophagostomum dentatum]|uniref:Abnormal cell migration protein 18-like fibronectin type I domain-containing protein n=1 Tax=Oesophagostomum dentatum TaxID=61180 RepID=A0A0B1T1K2_OESDE|nr:hypothetical protein OESDEN_10127 [Oesophagostomum dentatum]
MRAIILAVSLRLTLGCTFRGEQHKDGEEWSDGKFKYTCVPSPNGSIVTIVACIYNKLEIPVRSSRVLDGMNVTCKTPGDNTAKVIKRKVKHEPPKVKMMKRRFKSVTNPCIGSSPGTNYTDDSYTYLCGEYGMATLQSCRVGGHLIPAGVTRRVNGVEVKCSPKKGSIQKSQYKFSDAIGSCHVLGEAKSNGEIWQIAGNVTAECISGRIKLIGCKSDDESHLFISAGRYLIDNGVMYGCERKGNALKYRRESLETAN